MERYRSGHNEAVLKTVCPKGRVGSNPTLSARTSGADLRLTDAAEMFATTYTDTSWAERSERCTIRRSTQAGRRDTPGKGAGRESGARVQIPPSPLDYRICTIKCEKNSLKNLLTSTKVYDNIIKLMRQSLTAKTHSKKVKKVLDKAART